MYGNIEAEGEWRDHLNEWVDLADLDDPHDEPDYDPYFDD